jgi:hypothetical protein
MLRPDFRFRLILKDKNDLFAHLPEVGYSPGRTPTKETGFLQNCGLEQSIVVKNPVSEPSCVQDYKLNLPSRTIHTLLDLLTD